MLFFSKKQAWLAAFVFCFGFCDAQTYHNVLPNWGLEFDYQGGEYGGGVSLVDWNGDGFDDLSVCQNGSDPRFFENVNGTLVEIDPFFSNEYQLKQMNWVDFDNDGDKDLSATTHLQATRLFRNDNGELIEITATSGIDSTNYLTFGHSWGDYDRDGLLDLYICHYHYFESIPNQCYHNLGDGTFEEVATQIGISDFANFSFQGVWLDYNDDGWQDLFVINDRLYSSNHLYRNDGGTFTNVTLDANLEQYIFSMSNSVADYDNDGDFDIFVSNNPSGHLLHQQQDDGTFLEVADDAGVATYDMGWAGQWMDYDLDGWQDLHVNCSPFWSEEGQNKFYRNNQDGTFTYDVSMGFDDDLAWSHSSAVGDINNDGTFDIAVVNDFPDKSSLWISSPGENNYLKVGLKGAVSNKDGIGSKIMCYANNLTQMRYTYCGEGYLNQNSMVEIFGVGQAETIDSLEITWLSGHVDMFYDLDVNQLVNIPEGSSLSIDLEAGNSPYLCPGDTIAISAPDDYVSFLWSNGDTTQTTLSSSAETLFVTATNELGLVVVSNNIQTIMNEPLEVNWSSSPPSCFGESDGSIEVDLAISDSITIEWLDDFEGTSLDSLAAGEYSFFVTDSMGCVIENLVEIVSPEILQLNSTVYDVSCFGFTDGVIEINPAGGTGPTELDWNGINPDELAAGDYTVSITDSLGCSIEEILTVNEPEELLAELSIIDADGINLGSASIDIEGGVEPYDIAWSNAEAGTSATGFEQGQHNVMITDENGCVLTLEFSIINLDLNELGQATFNVYPNPVIDGEFQISAQRPIREVRIYSLQGKEVFNQFVNSGLDQTISSNLASGNYILEVRHVDGTSSRSSISFLVE